MRIGLIASVSTLAAAILVLDLTVVPVAGQAAAKPKPMAKTWTPPRTPDGQPDLQGTWNYATITPLERPRELAGKQVLTDEEAANFEVEQNRRENRDLIDPAKGGSVYPPGGVVPYNEFWYDRGTKVIAAKRTSLIVDPSDGRIPPLTPEGQRREGAFAAGQRESQLGHPRADSFEDRSLTERCILGFNAGPPMLPSAYNNNVQLLQTPGYVVILNEMIHDARIIPLDGRPHLRQHIRQWMGDSRGRWEGHTLVVDTANFSRETSFRGSSANMHLVERFTRVDADTITYEFTVDDPTTWTRPWTAAVPMTKTQGQIYEYACHEGNYGMFGILTGARAEEKAAEEPARKR
jgi:hypothetical protein